MMKSPIKVGVIGAGAIGNSHLKTYSEADEADPIAVADVNRERARKEAKKFGIDEVFTDYHELLEIPELEAVSICIPNVFHAPASIAALEAGKHVLCEKPLAVNADQAELMVRKSRETGKRLAMSLNLRHKGSSLMLKKAAEDGQLGEIYYGRGGMLRDNAIPRGWFHRKEFAGGGPLVDLASHILDLTWWIMGRPDPVSAFGSTFAKFGPRGLGMGSWGVGHQDGPFDVEDLGVGMIKFEGGQTLIVEASWVVNIETRTYSEVSGTEAGGSLLPDLNVKKTDGTPLQMEAEEDQDPRLRFLKDLIHGNPALGPGEDGLMVTRMLDAIYDSAETGKEVEL